jgi:hypothetical protein
MSYTLTIEPEIVKSVLTGRRELITNTIKIGSMRDEIKLPDSFDETFDSLDGEVASMFMGDAS